MFYPITRWNIRLNTRLPKYSIAAAPGSVLNSTDLDFLVKKGFMISKTVLKCTKKPNLNHDWSNAFNHFLTPKHRLLQFSFKLSIKNCLFKNYITKNGKTNIACSHLTGLPTFVRTWGWIWFQPHYRRKVSSRWQWWFDSYHPVSPAGYGSSCCLGRGCRPGVYKKREKKWKRQREMFSGQTKSRKQIAAGGKKTQFSQATLTKA